MIQVLLSEYINISNFVSTRYKNSVLDLSLPLRFTNLVQNSKVDLAIATARMRAQNAKEVPVNIKLQVEDLPPEFSTKLVHQFTSNSTLWEVFKHFERTSGILFTTRSKPINTSPNSGNLFYEIPSVQSFGGKISDLKEFAKTLGELGFNHRQENLRIRFEVTDIPYTRAIEIQNELFSGSNNSVSEPKEPLVEEKSLKPLTPKAAIEAVQTTVQSPAAPVEPEAAPPSIKSPQVSEGTYSVEIVTPVESSQPEIIQDRGVKVYLPAATQQRPTNIEENDFKPTVAHSQIYQAQIQKALKRSEGPLLTKELRESMEAEKYKKPKKIQIRIRFPDLTHIEGTFNSTENISQVISFTRTALNNPELPFKLFTSPPKTFYTDETKLLGRHCKFGARVLLSVEWDLSSGLPKTSFPTSNILKQDFLKSGTSIADSYSKPSDEPAAMTQGQSVTAKAHSVQKAPMSDAQKKNIMSKFIKLGKK